MPKWIRALIFVGLPLLAAAAVPGLHAQDTGNPACDLLTAADLKQATGQTYDEPSPGDEMGEGAGGGASCQWGDPVGLSLPMISVVLIPSNGKKSYTQAGRELKERPGCVREPVSGVGDDAYLRICERDRGPVVFFRKGQNDGLVQIDAVKPATAASVKPKAIALAKAVVTHMP